MSLRLQPVQVATGSTDTEGRLVLADDHLVAILVRLSDDHQQDGGKWFLETGFGRVDVPFAPLFPGLEEAKAWIAERLAQDAD